MTHGRQTNRRRARLLGVALSLALASLAPTCVPAPVRDADTLTLGCYSVVREAIHDAIIPAFARHWKQKTGRLVRFEESYNASGAQARAIAAGFDADVAILSLEGDIDLLVKAGVVDKNWAKTLDRGMITRSLVVIGVRPGNPLGIRDWPDLARSGVGVLYPDPKTSGGARWNINAIYGSAYLAAGKSRDTARDFLAKVQANVVNMDSSGRQSVATFGRGTGDALVTYENELLLQTKMTGVDAPYAIPPSTLLIEGPAAIVDASVKAHGNRPLAEAFLAFLKTPEAQAILAEYGFRPTTGETPANRLPLPAKLFTMKDLGGWGAIKKDVYDPGGVWDSLFTGKTTAGRK